MRIRVVFLTHYIELYGANRSLVTLIDGLAAHGVEAHVMSPNLGAVTEALQGLGVSVQVAPFQTWMTPQRTLRGALKRLRKNARLLPPLARKLKLWGADIIYTNSSITPMGAMLAGFLRLPHVWHLREFGDLDYGLQHDWGAGVFRHVVARAAAQIAVSEAIREHHLRGMVPERVHVIYNGVASEARFDRLRILDRADSEPRTGYEFVLVGVLHPSKGHETAIRALAIVVRRHPGVRLSIVGSGDLAYAEKCKELAFQLGVSQKVTFQGYVSDPFEPLAAADAALMCSEHEAMGRTTVEAMAACRPVIGFDNAGTSELVVHEHNGLLYRGDHEALAQCMCRLVENPHWARDLGQNGWRMARREFSNEAHVRQVYSILKSVVR